MRMYYRVWLEMIQTPHDKQSHFAVKSETARIARVLKTFLYCFDFVSKRQPKLGEVIDLHINAHKVQQAHFLLKRITYDKMRYEVSSRKGTIIRSIA